MPEIQKTIFCASCQSDTPHAISRVEDRNGHNEMIAVCQTDGCARSLKFPMPESPAQFEEWLAAHRGANSGQITVEAADADAAKKDAAFLAAIGEA